ncbi:MAG: hypothetical protein ACRDG5_10560, partial [Anaerolineales bacterium]
LARPDARRLSPEQVETAWHYAYRFFFDFPLPFPWHLLHFWKDMQDRPFEAVVESALEGPYRAAFEALMAGPAPWETEPEGPETGFLPVGGSAPREGAAR